MLTKQKIRTMIDTDCWWEALNGKTVQQNIAFLSQYAPDVIMGDDPTHPYDFHGCFYVEREETGEEYAARLAKEADEERKEEEAERKRQEKQAKAILAEAAKDAALKAYVAKHKDNPNLGDLTNLCMSVLGLVKSGARESVIAPLLECMERLEKGEQ